MTAACGTNETVHRIWQIGRETYDQMASYEFFKRQRLGGGHLPCSSA